MSDGVLPMFPLGMVVFPHQVVGLCVFEPRYQTMLRELPDDHRFGTCMIERGFEVGGGDVRASVGTVLRILGSQILPDGQTLLRVEGTQCVEVSSWLADAPYPRASVRERCCDEEEIEPSLLQSTESAVRALRALRSEVLTDERLRHDCVMDTDPWVRSWQLCAMTPMSTLDQFKVLSLSDPNDRLRLVAEICCERYGDYQRLLADDPSRYSFD